MHHCSIYDNVWWVSNSLTIKSRSTCLMCSHCAQTLQVKKTLPVAWVGHWKLSIKIHLKALRQPCLLATMLTSHKFVLPHLLNLQKTKQNKIETLSHTDSMTSWMVTVWRVRFAEIIRGMPTTFTSDNLIANLSNSKVPCSAVAISHISHSHRCLVAVAFSDAVSVAWHGEQKVTDGEESALGLASTVLKAWVGPTNIFDMLEIHQTVWWPGREQIISSWQNQIWPELWDKLCKYRACVNRMDW